MEILRTVGVRYARSKGRDDEVCLESDRLFLIVNPLTILCLLSTMELHGHNPTILLHDLRRVHERQELALLFLRQLHLPAPVTYPRRNTVDKKAVLSQGNRAMPIKVKTLESY